MSRREFLRKAAAGSAGVVGAAAGFPLLSSTPRAWAQEGGGSKPLNFLIIITDQFSPRAMGAAGHNIVKTPNLDRLASQGARFAHAYTTTPVCSPSRYTMMTGTYATRTGVLTNEMKPNENIKTLAHYFNEAGYQTCSVGKLHYIPYGELHGFQYALHHEFYITEAGISDYAPWLKERLGVRYDIERRAGLPKGWNFDPRGVANPCSVPLELSDAHWLTDRCTEWLSQIRDKDKPFFLHASYFQPHHPYNPVAPFSYMYDPDEMELPPNYIDPAGRGQFKRFTAADFKRTMAYYYGFISEVDYEIGRLLRALDKLGLSDNTCVLFLADHGDMMGEKGRLYKGLMYDASAGIPMIMRCPGLTSSGATVQDNVSMIDVAPTFLSLAGIQAEGLQGRDMTGLLRGKESWEDNVVYSMDIRKNLSAPLLMARDKRFKRIVNRHKAIEFYDMQNDPWEQHNLFPEGKASPEFTRLKEKLDAFWAVESKFLPERAVFEPRKQPPDAKPGRWPWLPGAALAVPEASKGGLREGM